MLFRSLRLKSSGKPPRDTRCAVCAKVYEGTRPLTAEDIAAKKCASPYIGERFGENSVGGKWLMGAGLRIPLTLLGRGQGAFGGEIILLNCCKWLQINGPFFRLLLIYPRAERGLIGGHRGGRGTGERGARNSSFILHPSSFEPSLPGCGAKRPCRSSGLRRGEIGRAHV